jgi:hypothetical protein
VGASTLEWLQRGEGDCLGLRIDAFDAQALASLGPEGLARRFPVYPASAIERGRGSPIPSILQATSGSYRLESGAVVFAPRFPFVPGADYAVVVSSGNEEPIVLSIRYPATDRPPATSVVRISPAVEEVPRNLLRLYVEFSEPMSEGFGTRCVGLFDSANGAELRHALLPMEPELWDRQRRRLTVLLDPARIKRGLVPHREAGYPLVEGTTVEVRVDPSFLDASGRPLVTEGRLTYRVGPDLRGLVDPARWSVGVPAPGSADELRVDFDRPLDVGLLAHCLAVLDSDGGRVHGAAVPADDGLAWSFIPRYPWVVGAYRIAVDPILEDVAGNSVQRVFDRDMSNSSDDPRPACAPTIPIEVQ